MLILLLFCGLGSVLSNYTPDWKSLDSRPLPSWYDDSKLGIFVHWGVFSVPAFKSEWIWWFWKQGYSDVVNFMNKNFPGQSYADLGSKFTAADFNADSFLSIVKSSGAKYIVVTTKHHEGYTLWPSETSFNWNSVDLGPHRDLVREFRDSTLKQGLHFGTYFSQFDWFHPLYLKDNANKTREYPEKVSLVQMRELINNYKPEVLWSDGDWEKSDDYWGAKEFLAWVFNDSPVKESIVVNDRWGKGIPYNHGSFITGNDGYMPGKLLTKKWECCSSLIRGSFGYRRNLRSGDVETSKETIDKFVKILAWGGNLLLNIGPDQYGNIPAILEERLQEVGAFVNANSEAIYGSKPWIYQNDTVPKWKDPKTGELESLSFNFNLCEALSTWEQVRNSSTILTREYIDGLPHGWEEYAWRRINKGILLNKCQNKTLCMEKLALVLPDTPPFLPRQYGRCAVVGNSGDLLKTKFGKEIDSYDAIIRGNGAPTKNYTQYVGKKVTFRLLNRGSAKALDKVAQLDETGKEVLIIKTTIHDIMSKMIREVPIPNPVYLMLGTSFGSSAKGTGVKALEFSLSVCDSVDVYGFTVDPGYTEWTRYFSESRQGHTPLQGRAYYQMMECLGLIRIHSPMRAAPDRVVKDRPDRGTLYAARIASERVLGKAAQGRGDPLAACTIWKDRSNGMLKKSSNLRKAAVKHQSYVHGVTMYPLEHKSSGEMLCIRPRT